MEVTSPDTRPYDFADRPDAYRRAGVRYYVALDVRGPADRPFIDLYAWSLQVPAAEPERLVPEANGGIWLEPVRVSLSVDGDR